MVRVLVIDDDSELCELLAQYLQPEGFLVEAVQESLSGFERALSGDHSMVVLDVMLPQISGFEVLQRIRRSSGIPILMLTARGDEVDRIVGLEMGADDYLPKPFNPRELVARLRAIRRRTEKREKQREKETPEQSLKIGDLTLEPGTRTVIKTGRQVPMTAAEFSFLQELMQQAGKVVSRDHLSEKVLGRKLMMFDRSVDVHIYNLRRKLGAATDGFDPIKTIRGAGYMFVRAGNHVDKV